MQPVLLRFSVPGPTSLAVLLLFVIVPGLYVLILRLLERVRNDGAE